MTGILDALLTGGILIGKICQSLAVSTADGNRRHEAGVRITNDVTSGGAIFYHYISGDGSEIRVFNPSTSLTLIVTVPNTIDISDDNTGEGVIYTIAPTQSIPFAEANSPFVPPSVSVLAGNVPTPPSRAAGGGQSLLKLAFQNVRIGRVAQIGSFKLSCTTTQLVVVSSALTISALSYMYLSSNKGVEATSTQKQPPDPSSSSDTDKTYTFDIDFEALGIDPVNDNFGGTLTFDVDGATPEAFAAISKAPSRPLDAAERAHFGIA